MQTDSGDDDDDDDDDDAGNFWGDGKDCEAGQDATGEDSDYQFEEEEEDDDSDEEDGSTPPRVRRRRASSPMISPATAIGARDADNDSPTLDSPLERFFSRGNRRGAARVGARFPSAGGTANTGGGGAAGSSAGSAAGTLGSSGRLPSSAARDSTATICSSMSSDEVFNCLRSVSSSTVLAGLAGHLLPHVAPTFAMVGYVLHRLLSSGVSLSHVCSVLTAQKLMEASFVNVDLIIILVPALSPPRVPDPPAMRLDYFHHFFPRHEFRSPLYAFATVPPPQARLCSNILVYFAVPISWAAFLSTLRPPPSLPRQPPLRKPTLDTGWNVHTSGTSERW